MVKHLQDSSATEDSCRLERQCKSCGTAAEQNTEAIYSETGHRTFLEPRLAPCAAQVRELFESCRSGDLRTQAQLWSPSHINMNGFYPSPIVQAWRFQFHCFHRSHGYCILYSKRTISHQWWMPQWPECET